MTKRYKLLITGAGRSGTTYMANVLKKCGLDIGHEVLGADGTVSSFMCFDYSLPLAKTGKMPDPPPGPRPKFYPEFDITLHQVRHPIPAISSMLTGHTWKWTCQFLRVDESTPLLRRCCYNWLDYNLEAERKSLFTYRIENLEETWRELQETIGFGSPYADIVEISIKTNSRSHKMISWEDIAEAAPEIVDDIFRAARRYGYSL